MEHDAPANHGPDPRKEAVLALVVQSLIALSILLSVVNILALLAQGRLLKTAAAGGTISDEQIALNDGRIAMLGYMRIGLLIVSVIAWLPWLWRAYRNLQLVGSRQTDVSPAWALGYWFIPIINLFKPYQIMKELWSRSAQRNAPGFNRNLPDPSLVGLWWGIWLANNVFSRYAERSSEAAQTVPTLVAANRVLITSNLGAILAAALALMVVTRIHKYQQMLSVEPVAVAPIPTQPAV